MRSYGGRLKRIEASVGVSTEKEYAVFIYGHRTYKDCIKTGRPVFRGPNGNHPYVAGVHVFYAGKCVDTLDPSKEETKAVTSPPN
jgi:hypothetical protein